MTEFGLIIKIARHNKESLLNIANKMVNFNSYAVNSSIDTIN